MAEPRPEGCAGRMESHRRKWLKRVILTTKEVETGRIMVRAQLRQKVSKTLISTNKLGIVICTSNPSYRGGTGRIMI
jgi:hypothetical protein